MHKSKIEVNGRSIDLYTCNTVVVGSGAAGYNAADWLHDYGQTDIAIVTEGEKMGTSRNTGSDKQTYYKLTLAGGAPDSVADMAQTLFEGGCMHGDLALCEAAGSAASFYKLVSLGVPFPHNRYGEYVGYKTDHDPRQRATSAGPLTSRFMTERLEARVKSKNTTILDGYKVIGIVVQEGICRGVLALNKKGLENADTRFALFNCTNVILATGGPAGLYSRSVYPQSQTGSAGMAFEAGVRGRNLTEWQYGIASTRFRWNLSGTYQQVLPRYVSTDADGNDPREFLDAGFPDATSMLGAIFLKGYQWPFDARKVDAYGSSTIDILVYREIEGKGRRVFLDFRQNPSALAGDFSNLDEEVSEYLRKSGALQATPIERLAHMNQPAIDLYRSHGIDLADEMLEIAVCAQHNNGGLAVNAWWETNVPHLFSVGEAAGTHGIYRPGGSALNSGQVGSQRAALFITKRYQEAPLPEADFISAASDIATEKAETAERFFANQSGDDVRTIRKTIGDRMSKYAAHIRTANGLATAKAEAKQALSETVRTSVLKRPADLVTAFENIDLLKAQCVYVASMEDYIARGGGSRGSCLVLDKEGQDKSTSPARERETLVSVVQETKWDGRECSFEWDDVRPIPAEDGWFENVWKDYREEKIFSK